MWIIADQTRPNTQTFFHNTDVILWQVFLGQNKLKQVLELYKELLFVQIRKDVLSRVEIFSLFEVFHQIT